MIQPLPVLSVCGSESGSREGYSWPAIVRPDPSSVLSVGVCICSCTHP